MRYFFIVLLLICSSCIQIGSDPKPLHYYLLEAPTNQPQIYSSKKLNISIELIKFPEYLDRLQIVTNDQKNSVILNENQRWANPLSDNILQVLRENLVLALPDSIVTIHPWEDADTPATKLKLSVDKFAGKPGETANVAIRWNIIDAEGESLYGTFSEQQPVAENFSDLVAGLNDSLNRFSQSIAKQLANQ